MTSENEPVVVETDDQHGIESKAGHGRATVIIVVDGKDREIHRGRQPVSEIKRVGLVPPAYELAQVLLGQPLQPLPDDGSVVIKGGEEFVSYPKDSASSFARPNA